MMRRVVTSVVCGLLLVAPISLLAQRSTQKQAPVNQLQNELSSLRNQKKKVATELTRTKREAKVVLGDIARVDTRLNQLEGELEVTSSRLDESRRDQQRLTQDLVDATARLARTKDLVERRLRRMYVSGNTSFISAVVGTRTVGELATQKYRYQSIAQEDRRIFEEYKELQAKVREQKTRTDELVKRIDRLASNQRAQQSNLKDARQEKGVYLRELRTKEDRLQSLLRQFEQDERQIVNQIAAASRRPRTGEAPLPAFTGRFMKPVNGTMTSGFGNRLHPILKVNRLHAGVDFGAPTGTPIYAAAAGEVIGASYMGGYGNVVILDHGGGISTVYAHCSRILVRVGQRVDRGQHIAAVGSTGLSTGPHLHWEVRVSGRPVNPLGRF
jgi:murein DD-endopeptidase MepM/ murein hydrolase activator NlpD